VNHPVHRLAVGLVDSRPIAAGQQVHLQPTPEGDDLDADPACSGGSRPGAAEHARDLGAPVVADAAEERIEATGLVSSRQSASGRSVRRSSSNAWWMSGNRAPACWSAAEIIASFDPK
jgi:hypothetical protein